MDYEGVSGVVCDAEESDWLDVSYTERKYIPQKSRFKLSKIKLNKVWKYALVAVLCVAVLATMLFLDGNFKQDVFNAVKSASASVFTAPEATENKINIPCNLNLVNIQDGVMTFDGGRAALSLCAGKIAEVTEDSVTIALDEDTKIVYSGLKTTYVKVGDEIAANGLIGKYDGQFTASITENGEIVKQVVGSESQLTWEI